MKKECARIGCSKPPLNRGIYCSHNCLAITSEIRSSETKWRNEVRHAEKHALKAEPCRNCPGAYSYEDERGDRMCSCGRLVGDSK